MIVLTAKQHTTVSLLSDLKEVCGDRFQDIPQKVRLAMMTALSHFQLHRAMEPSWSLGKSVDEVVPVRIWLDYPEVKARLLACYPLDESAIAYIIQILAEAA